MEKKNKHTSNLVKYYEDKIKNYDEVLKLIPKCKQHSNPCLAHINGWIKRHLNTRLQIKEKAITHKVKLDSVGVKSHFYDVTNTKGQTYNVNLSVGCTCDYCSKEGISNKERCSYVLSVLKKIYEDTTLNIPLTNYHNEFKRNNALTFLERGYELNTVNTSETEGEKHKVMKTLICAELLSKGEFFITEARFKPYKGDKGVRADIFNVDKFQVIELVDTEDEHSLNAKKKKYDNRKIRVLIVKL